MTLCSHLDCRRARWGSGYGIRHADVSQTHVDTFEADLISSYDAEQARDKFLGFCKAWRRAVAALADVWPQVHIEWRLRLWETSPLTDYPKRLQEQIDEMLQQRRECDSDFLSPWRAPADAETERTIRYWWRRLLHAVCKGNNMVPLDLLSLGVALTPRHVDRAMVWLARHSTYGAARAGQKSEYLYGLVVEARNVARHYLKLGKSDIEEFDRIVSARNPHLIGRSERSNRMMLRICQPSVIAGVRGLSAKVLLKHGEKPAGQSARIDVEDALTLSTGILLALQIGEVVRLRVEHDFVVTGDFDRVQYRVGNRYKIKTAELIDMPDEWVRLVRLHAALSRVPNEAGALVFPGSKPGCHRHPAIMSRRIAKCTALECGERITAGHFQDLALAIRLDIDPTDIGGAADMVGHLKDSHVRDAFQALLDRPIVDEYDDSLREAVTERRSRRTS